MTELEQRKRLLIAESEVFRESLKLQFHNFRIYQTQARRKAASFSLFGPALMMGLPVLFGGRVKFTWSRLGAYAFLGWRAYKKLLPLVAAFFGKSRDPDETSNAAEEHLASRL